MLRFLVVIERNGSRTSHGTTLWNREDDVFITSKPIGDQMGAAYFISRDGSMDQDVIRVVDSEEVIIPAPGIAVRSIEPFVYRLELEEQI